MTRIRTTVTATALLAAALAVPVAAAAPALARSTGSQGGRPGVQASGSCSQTGTWKLKAEADDPAIVQIEFEVDTNVAGQVFTVRLTDGPTVVFQGTQTTAGRSGSFSLARTTADRAGRDTIRATATSGANTCAGVVRL